MITPTDGDSMKTGYAIALGAIISLPPVMGLAYCAPPNGSEIITTSENEDASQFTYYRAYEVNGKPLNCYHDDEALATNGVSFPTNFTCNWAEYEANKE